MLVFSFMKRFLLRIGLLNLVAVVRLFGAPDPDVPVLARLVFDADTKQYNATLADAAADFKFNLTNTWTNEITIDRVQTSCGCTVASLPSNPWHLAAGGHG